MNGAHISLRNGYIAAAPLATIASIIFYGHKKLSHVHTVDLFMDRRPWKLVISVYDKMKRCLLALRYINGDI